MPWTWVRPREPSLLASRPLLDVGCGDGQTMRSLAPGGIGVDSSAGALRAARRSGVRHLIRGTAQALPVQSASCAVVLAADLVHHFDDDELAAFLSEARRVLRGGGRLVAWWYRTHGRPGPGSPRYAREVPEVATAVRGWSSVAELALDAPPGGHETVGITALA